jgi:hypothetical protein
MTETGSVLVVLGVGADDKPHASRFTEEDTTLAIRAARLMNFHAVRVTDPELQKAVEELPIGKIFATGRGLVPFVKRELYDKLAVLIGTDAEAHQDAASNGLGEAQQIDKPATTEDAAKTTTAATAMATPEDPWAAIVVGSTVLGYSKVDESWFEAIVVGIGEDKNTLTLRWRDYGNEPPVKANRRSVGVMGSMAA